MPGTSASVLVIRLDAIGDALALAPLLAALHERGIAVDLLLRPQNADIFAPRAARRIVVASDLELRSSGRKNLSAIAQLGEGLSANGYTHVLVATEDPAGYRLAGATKAPARIGFTNALGKPFKTFWTRRFINLRVYRSAGLDRRAPHESEVLFRLGATLLGAAAPTHDIGRLRPLVLEDPENGRSDDRIAVQITDKWERLGIPLAGVVALLERLEGFGGLRLLSAAAEDDYASRIEAATGLNVERFAALEPWKAAIDAAPAIVTPDSGALHVAGTIGTPVVAVFPDGRDAALQVARWSPWAAPHRIVRAKGDWPVQAANALAQLL